MKKFEITGIEPVFEVNDMKKTLEYYKRKLYFNVDWTWPEEGDIDHAGISFGSEGDDHDKHTHVHFQLSYTDKKINPGGWTYFKVKQDIDELYSQYKKNGVNITSDIADYPWGMREFDVTEINGYVFRFGFPLPHN